MKLDPRIKEFKKPLTPFDNEEAKKYIGKECYFSCVATDFGDLDYCAKGIMRLVAGECPFAFDDDEGNHHGCTYCLPCEWIEKEKNYRPFIIEEFENKHYFDIVVFRKKKGNVELHSRYNGYTYSKERGFDVLLGCEYFSFEELFNNYELQDSDGNWKPFGVEE